MLFLTKCATIIYNTVMCWMGLGSMAAIDRMLCQEAEHFCILEGMKYLYLRIVENLKITAIVYVN